MKSPSRGTPRRVVRRPTTAIKRSVKPLDLQLQQVTYDTLISLNIKPVVVVPRIKAVQETICV